MRKKILWFILLANTIFTMASPALAMKRNSEETTTTTKVKGKRNHCKVDIIELIEQTLNESSRPEALIWIIPNKIFAMNFEKFHQLYNEKGSSSAKWTSIKNRLTRSKTGFEALESIPPNGYDKCFTNKDWYNGDILDVTRLYKSILEKNSPQQPVQYLPNNSQFLNNFVQDLVSPAPIIHFETHSQFNDLPLNIGTPQYQASPAQINLKTDQTPAPQQFNNSEVLELYVPQQGLVSLTPINDPSLNSSIPQQGLASLTSTYDAAQFLSEPDCGFFESFGCPIPNSDETALSVKEYLEIFYNKYKGIGFIAARDFENWDTYIRAENPNNNPSLSDLCSFLKRHGPWPPIGKIRLISPEAKKFLHPKFSIDEAVKFLRESKQKNPYLVYLLPLEHYKKETGLNSYGMLTYINNDAINLIPVLLDSYYRFCIIDTKNNNRLEYFNTLSEIVKQFVPEDASPVASFHFENLTVEETKRCNGFKPPCYPLEQETSDDVTRK